MAELSPRRRRRGLKPGDVIRLPRRFIEALRRDGTDDRAIVVKVYKDERVVYVRLLKAPWTAVSVRRENAR